MSGPALILREAHRLRKHVKDLETKIEQGPKLLRSGQIKLANQEEQLKQAQDVVKRVKMQMHEKEVSVKATQAQLEKYEKQVSAVTSQKEYKALQLEVANQKGHITKLEDEILELMGEADDKAKLLPDIETAVKKAKAEFAQLEAEHDAKLQRWAAERDRAAAELQTVEASLPAEVKPLYQRLVTAKGADALAGVGGRICSACYTEITSQMSGDLKQDNYVLCKNCGRILYLEA